MDATLQARMVSVPGRYALALYKALTPDRAMKLVGSLNNFMNAFTHELLSVLQAHKAYPHEVDQLIKNITTFLEEGEKVGALMSSLIEHKRIKTLQEVIHLFIHYTYACAHQKLVTVVTAHPLSKASTEKLEKNLIKKYGQSLAFQYQHQPNLLSGLCIYLGAERIDASSRGYLERLTSYLKDTHP